MYTFTTCSQGVSSTKDSNRKNMQNNRKCPSLTKDGQFTSLGPQALQAAHCSWGGGCVCVCVCVDFMVYVHAFFKEHVGIWVFCVRGSVCVCVHRLMYMVS